MVVGNGMIAQKFKDYQGQDQFLIFASGVSNSKNTDPNNFAREKDMLSSAIEANSDKMLVYFSTCSMYDPAEQSTPYVLHKKEMEQLIESKARKYIIFRTSNVVGHSGNPNTIFNYFIHNIVQSIPFSLWVNAGRNLIDVDDILLITNNILQHNQFSNTIVNIANPQNYSVKEIVQRIENIFDKKADYVSIEKGNSPLIDISLIIPIIKQLDINFDATYLSRLIKKYHSNA